MSNVTESRNPRSEHLDRLPVPELVRLFLEEDARINAAILAVDTAIVRAVTLVTAALQAGGRLIYCGAGTSGRLGLLDASECPPTFGVGPDMVQALMAGGLDAFTKAIEGAEDDESAGARDLEDISFSSRDILLGIAASGTTPYVRGACRHARRLGAKTILLACNPATPSFPEVDVLVNPVTGPELLTGSTRLKAGTATKLVLNMISTISMVQLGKAYRNLMVDVQATNAKLRERAIRIVMEGSGIERERARQLLEATGGNAKQAIYLAHRGGTPAEAVAALQAAGGRLYKALGEPGHS